MPHDPLSKTRTILAEITAERLRQIEVEGCTPAMDSGYVSNELLRAALVYAEPERLFVERQTEDHRGSYTMFEPLRWPWQWHFLKRKSRREDLIRAAALLAAEIERLDRWDAAERKEKLANG